MLTWAKSIFLYKEGKLNEMSTAAASVEDSICESIQALDKELREINLKVCILWLVPNGEVY